VIATESAAASLPRDPRLVLIVRATMDATTLQAVGGACARARARACVWSEGMQLDASPSLVVGALAAGARHIPDAILELADGRFPGTPLLLVCDEPLTRPTVTLQMGRLTLVEPPLTQARMVSRVRLLLADAPHDEVLAMSPLAPQPPGGFKSREYRQQQWWAAELMCSGRNQEHGGAPPQTWLGGGDGLTALLAPPATAIARTNLDRALDIVRHGAHRANDAAALEQALGTDVGLIHLTSHARDWIIYWPCHERPLWLFSPLRLPRWSDLALVGSSSLWHVPAASGDIVVALSSRALFAGSAPPLPTAPPSTEASSAMLDGGPALLDLMEARLSAAPQPFSSVLAEVR
jgi:hypothetical protein